MKQEPVHFCAVKRERALAWEQATDTYAKTLRELTQQIGKVSPVQYEKLRSRVEDARDRSKAARAAFDDHVVEHGC